MASRLPTWRCITPEKAETWLEMAASGSKLVLMVPKDAKVRATELIWQKGIMDKVAVGTYDIQIEMP
jgi:hypothetical protein